MRDIKIKEVHFVKFTNSTVSNLYRNEGKLFCLLRRGTGNEVMGSYSTLSCKNGPGGPPNEDSWISHLWYPEPNFGDPNRICCVISI